MIAYTSSNVKGNARVKYNKVPVSGVGKASKGPNVTVFGRQLCWRRSKICEK